MTDTTSGLGNEPAASDLDSLITGAIEQHTPKEEAPVAEAAPESAPEQKADHPTDNTRYADGTFKPTKPVSAEPAASQEPTVDAATTAPAPAAEPALQPIEPPSRWTADKKAVFQAWPRDVQEAVIERNREIEADHTRKTQEAAELRRSAEPYLNAVKPWEPYLTQLGSRIGVAPGQMISNLVGVEYQLRTGDPYQKVQALNQIATEYGIDLAALSRGEMPAAPDPHLQQLRQSFGGVDQRLGAVEQLLEQWQQQQTASQIEAFANAKDDSGRPKHPHFERVRGVMGQMFRDDPSISLDAAYQKAIEPIQAAIAEGLRKQQETVEAERKAAIEKAKKAAPVVTSGSQPNGSTKSKDLDSMLWDNINAKLS